MVELGEASFRCLETLLLDLGLGVGNVLGRVGVFEAAASLAVLELGADTRADTGGLAGAGGGATGAASLLAIGIGNTATSSELLTVWKRGRGVSDEVPRGEDLIGKLLTAVTDITGSRGVGGESHDGDREGHDGGNADLNHFEGVFGFVFKKTKKKLSKFDSESNRFGEETKDDAGSLSESDGIGNGKMELVDDERGNFV